MAFWIVAIQLGVLALSLVASHYLAPKATDEAAKAAGLGDFNFPRATQGDVIPLAWGTVRIRSPLLVWFGDVLSTPIVVDGGALGSDATIGYRYYVSMRFILCRGNTPVSETGQFAGASFRALYIGDKPVNLGVLGEFGSGFAGQVFDDDSPGIPGNDQFQGYHYFYRGRWDQTLATPVGAVGNPIDLGSAPEEDTTITPRYRGQVMASVRQWYCGETPTIAPLSWLIHNPVTIPGYEDECAPIGNGDANPAAVLYDILTNPWGGIGSPTSAIDTAGFAAVAQTLQDEEHGISLVISRAVDARQVIEEVLRQIDGVLYEDPETRKYTLALIREDYTLGSLFVVDEDNTIGEPELSSSLWAETVNEVRVIWTDPSRLWADGASTAQDLAHINAQGGRRRSAEYRFPGISNAGLAARIATRELNLLSRPIMKLRIAVNRTAIDLRPGDAFRFQWSAWGLDAVFRVGELEGGTLQDGRIVINAVQDRFSVAGALLPPPESIGESPGIASPVLLRTITEAPRWIQLKAFEAGTIANVDAQHGYHLAWPEGEDDQYRVDTDSAGDLAARSFPGRFELDDVYLRTAGPYDTTGIQIRSVAGWTPTSATSTQIATEGRNLIQIDDEIMAFETATFVSGTTWTLDNVWRGVLDTVPADHAEGAAGYVLPGDYGTGAMGGQVLVHGATVTARTLAGAAGSWTPAAESPTDDLTARSRVRLPYPVDALTVNGSQSPTTLADDGAVLSFAKRDRTKGTITRPDTATETVTDGTTYNAVAYKGTGPLEGGTQILIASGVASGATVHHLGTAGHGTLEVGVDSALAVALPDGTTPTLGAWQVPTVTLEAPCHRNLIINGKFDDGTNNWTVTAGTASAGSGSGSLGGGGTMITAAAATTTLTFYQDIPIEGYPPSDLRAWLEFAAGPTGADANDTFEVTLTSRDSSGTTLDTATIAATHPSAWDRYSVEIANLDVDTASIRVSFTLAIATSGDGGDTHVDIGVTEVRLHVGQFTDQLLSDAEFAALTAWSQTVGTWSIKTATLYDCAQYVRPDDGASAQLRQAITPAAGWERNATAVLRCGRMNDDVDDTGAVVLQALDGSSTVLASVTTGAEASTALGGANVWARRYLALDLPDGTVTVRVQLDATRVTGTPLNACFGSFELRIHKALDASVDIDHTFDAPPTQRLPMTRAEWVAAFPNVTAPNVAIYAGRDVGELGSEPLLATVGNAALAGSLVADEGRDDGRMRTRAYDLTGGSLRTDAIGTGFMNFRSTEDWAVGVVYKSGVFTSAASGLVARYEPTDDLGWGLGLTSAGRPTATLYGATTTATVSGTAPALSDPGPHALRIIYLHYDATAEEVTIIDDVTATTASTTGIGEIRATVPARVTIGASVNFPELAGQIGRVYAWRGATTPSVTDLQATITYATNPTGVTDPNPRTGYVITADGSDADGLTLRCWPPGVAPHALDEELAGIGIIAAPAATNLVAPDLSLWSTVGSATITTVADPLDGMPTARRIVSASGDGLRSPAIAFGSAATVHVKIGYIAASGATLILEDNSGSTVATSSLAASSTGRIHEAGLAWSGATAGNGRLRVTSGGTGQAIDLSSVMYAGLVDPGRRVFPIGTPGSVCPSVLVSPTSLYNAEGELFVDLAATTQGTATLARAWNGTNTNDNRQIRLVSGDLVGKHATGAGTNTDATATLTLDTAVRYQARLRWATVELRDGTASEFSSIRGEQGALVDDASGRSTTWTPSTTALQIVDLGHDDGSDVAAAVIGRVRLRAREPRL